MKWYTDILITGTHDKDYEQKVFKIFYSIMGVMVILIAVVMVTIGAVS